MTDSENDCSLQIDDTSPTASLVTNLQVEDDDTISIEEIGAGTSDSFHCLSTSHRL